MKTRTILIPLFGSFAVGLVGCAANSQNTRPQDMSAEEHSAAADKEEAAAQHHQDEYTSSARTEQVACDGSTDASGVPICWTEMVNPTEEHKQKADKHRELAAKHRAASLALVQAEKSACEGISEDDRAMSPFAHSADVLKVTRIERQEDRRTTPAAALSDQGVAITLKAVPKLTRAKLQSLVDCHMARNAALGHKVPEMPYCPLVPHNVGATVGELKGAFVVRVTSPDDEVAIELWERAQLIKPGE